MLLLALPLQCCLVRIQCTFACTVPITAYQVGAVCTHRTTLQLCTQRAIRCGIHSLIAECFPSMMEITLWFAPTRTNLLQSRHFIQPAWRQQWRQPAHHQLNHLSHPQTQRHRHMLQVIPQLKHPHLRQLEHPQRFQLPMTSTPNSLRSTAREPLKHKLRQL